MQAIILAAGMGRRLGELTNDNTKCMLQVNGVRLIHRILDSLYEAGIRKVVLVVGYKAENVKGLIGDEYRGMEIVYVENSVYDKTNNIYSLYLAREYLTADDTLLLESDLIFEGRILTKIINHPYPNLALVDKYESWMDGTVVTLNEDNSVVEFLTKDKFKYSDIERYYKTVNIYKFSSKELAVRLLADHDILIKDCSGKSAFSRGSYIRLAVRDRNDNHKLTEALKEYI